MNEIKLYKSPLKALKLVLLALPFIAFSLYAIISRSTEMPVWFAWLSLCFFGSAVPLAVFMLLDKRPQIIINETGIFDRTAHKSFINWHLIADTYPVQVYGQKFICLVLRDEAIPLLKKKAKLNKLLGFQEINISLGQLKNVDEFKFAALIRQMAAAEPAEQQILLTTNIYE